jgi:hypothetical protein
VFSGELLSASMFIWRDRLPVVVFPANFQLALKFLANFLVIFYFCKSLFCVLQAVSTFGGALEYVFLGAFCLHVSSKLGLRGSVRRVIRVCERH